MPVTDVEIKVTAGKEGGRKLSRQAELTAVQERSDMLKYRHHRAQIAGEEELRERLFAEYQAVLGESDVLKDLWAADWLAGLRLAGELYSAQVPFYLEPIFKALMAPYEERLERLERMFLRATKGAA